MKGKFIALFASIVLLAGMVYAIPDLDRDEATAKASVNSISIVPTDESVRIVKITAESSLADRFAVASGYLTAAVRAVNLSRAKALTGDHYLATSIDFTRPSVPKPVEQPPLDVNANPPDRTSTGYDKPRWVVADAYDADVPYVRRT